MAAFVGIAIPECASVLFEAAGKGNVHLLTGWDVGGRVPTLKLYANAIDRPSSRADALGCISAAFGGPAWSLPDRPQIVGINLHPQAFELKAYVHAALASDAARAHGARAAQLASRIAAAGRQSGAVVAFDVRDAHWVPRAFIAGVSDGSVVSGLDPLAAELVAEMGCDPTRALAELAAPRSALGFLGVSLARPSETATIYLRPEFPGCLPPPARVHERWAALGAVFVSNDGCEVSIRIGPHGPGERTYAMVGPLGIAYGLRDRAPTPQAIERLMRWVITCAARSGELGDTDESARVLRAKLDEAPPAPWTRPSPRRG